MISLSSTARVILWSVSILITSLWIAALVGLPNYLVGLILLVASGWLLSRRASHWRSPVTWWKLLALLALFFGLVTAFTAPFVFWHDGLPTGDSEKAILWSQEINRTNHLPDYRTAAQLLNRDAVDFYTPGLHALVALTMQLIPAGPLIAVGLLAIVLSIATAFIAMAMAQTLWPQQPKAVAFFTVIFIVTNLRFLRYLREPGYHLQNILGELLLFGCLWLGIELVRRWRWADLILALMLAWALVLSHQFSTFLLAFALLPVVIFFLRSWWLTNGWPRLVSIIFTVSGIALAVLIIHRLKNIFTLTPHLQGLLPTITDYPDLLGALWTFLGLAGWLWLASNAWQTPTRRTSRVIWLIGVAILVILSQGPRFGIDIPPVRTLFYSVIPLSIGAALFLAEIFKRAGKKAFVIILVLLFPLSSSVSQAYALSHSLRTNSTLTAEQVYLNQYLTAQPRVGAILTDDYNRRSSSWLVLSGHPLFTRIAADLETQMNESQQSPTRYQLYLNQLDFEKIFDLGSNPLIESLLTKHGLRWITGIDGTSARSFQANPLLQAGTSGGDITLFAYRPRAASVSLDDRSRWLLRPSTLVNDIGDDEDTFEHLPASLRTTRLSDPEIHNGMTTRTTTAPLIGLSFNVGDYMRVLWDPEHIGRPMIPAELMVRMTSVPADLAVITPTGKIYTLPAGHGPITIDATDLPFDSDGFVRLTIRNPHEQPVSIDLIALGLARVP